MRKLIAAVALVGMLLVPATAEAQTTIGPVAGFHDDFDFGIGGFLGIPVPSLDPNLSINGDVVYAFEVDEDTPVLPFAMAGLNIARLNPDVGNGDTEMGLNLGGGIGFRAASVQPFVGAKFEIGDNDGFVVFGGIGFPLGG